MNYIEAPEEFLYTGKSLFLAGGITDCPNWQQEISEELEDESIIIFNPRRKYFPENKINAALQQVEWEFRYLRKATAISFWFPEETLCPIALYELGAWSMMSKPIFIGIHPNYRRKLDIEIETQFARPDIEIVYSLRELLQKILNWIHISD